MKERNYFKILLEALPLLSVLFVVIWEFSSLTAKVNSLEDKVDNIAVELVNSRQVDAQNINDISWIKSNCCEQAPVVTTKAIDRKTTPVVVGTGLK